MRSYKSIGLLQHLWGIVLSVFTAWVAWICIVLSCFEFYRRWSSMILLRLKPLKDNYMHLSFAFYRRWNESSNGLGSLCRIFLTASMRPAYFTRCRFPDSLHASGDRKLFCECFFDLMILRETLFRIKQQQSNYMYYSIVLSRLL